MDWWKPCPQIPQLFLLQHTQSAAPHSTPPLAFRPSAAPPPLHLLVAEHKRAKEALQVKEPPQQPKHLIPVPVACPQRQDNIERTKRAVPQLGQGR